MSTARQEPPERASDAQVNPNDGDSGRGRSRGDIPRGRPQLEESYADTGDYPGRYHLRRTVQRMRRMLDRRLDSTLSSSSSTLSPSVSRRRRRHSIPTTPVLASASSAPASRSPPASTASVVPVLFPSELGATPLVHNQIVEVPGTPLLDEVLNRGHLSAISETAPPTFATADELPPSRMRRALDFIRRISAGTPVAPSALPSRPAPMTNMLITVRFLGPFNSSSHGANVSSNRRTISGNSHTISSNGDGSSSGQQAVRFEYTVYFLSRREEEGAVHPPNLTPQEVAQIEARIHNLITAWTELLALAHGADTYEVLTRLQELLGVVSRGASLEDIEQQVGRQLFKDTGLASGFACSICLAEVRAEECTRKLPCGHVFHLECIDTWLQQCATCPLCRHQSVTVKRDADGQPSPTIPPDATNNDDSSSSTRGSEMADSSAPS
jgi:hypothetical protein